MTDGRPMDRPSTILVLVLVLALAAPSFAKGPTLDHLFPAGAARGATVEVAATGQFERWPVNAWCSTPGVEVRAGGEKGKLTVRVAADARPGVHRVRLFDDEGATVPRPFIVGTLPEVDESERNDEIGKAQRVEIAGLGTTVNGRFDRNGDVDSFRVTLRKGQTLVASMEANRHLGSPMDGVLQVVSSAGFVLAQVDDDHDRDPQIAFAAPSDGDYIVRAFAFPFVQESSIRFAGAPTYIYRLTLATTGFVDHVEPLAVSRGRGPSEVEAIGWSIPESARRLPIPEIRGWEGTIALGPSSLANPVEIRVADAPSILEAEPNAPGHAQAIPIPVAVTGRIEPLGDVDAFAFAARKDDRLAFRVESRSLGRPMDPALRVLDPSGAVVEEVDDSKGKADPEARFTAPLDGTYRVVVRDLNRQGGPRHAYLLTVEPPRPDFALTLKADQFTIGPGKPAEITVLVERREGYAEPIEIGLAERFDGVIAPPVASRKSGASASSATLKLLACPCARPGPIRIVGLAPDGRTRVATATVPGLSATIDSAWLTPTRPGPADPAPKKPD